MQFFYQGHLRLSLWFDNPNHAAAWLVMIAVAACALPWMKRFQALHPAIAETLLAAPLLALLGLTYSRGGYVGGLVSLATVAICRTQSVWKDGAVLLPQVKRRFPLVVWAPVLLLLALLLCLPASGARLAAVGDVHDLSIVHRLYLWRGGTMLAAQYPWRGVGEAPGEIYALFYQPLGTEEQYRGMINDFLYVGTSRGLPWSGFALALALLPVCLGFAVWLRFRDEMALRLGAALEGYLICGIFSTCCLDGCIQWTYCLVTAALLLRTVWVFWHRHATFDLLAGLLVAPVVACCACLGVYGLGRCFLSRWYYRTEPDLLAVRNAESFRLIPGKPNGGRITVLDETPMQHLRPILLPLVASGHQVAVFRVSGGTEGVSEIGETLLREGRLPGPWLVLGKGAAANATMSAVAELPPELQPDAIVLLDIHLEHPFRELAIERHPWGGQVILSPGEPVDERTAATLHGVFPQLRIAFPEDEAVRLCQEWTGSK